MGAGHAHPVYRERRTPVHDVPAHVKLVAVVSFVLVVVATPGTWYPAFAAYLVILAAVAGAARLRIGFIVPRLVVELPFVIFALLLPFVATGPRIEIGGISVSETGLVAGIALLMKATLSVIASIVFASTTSPREMVRGLERLRLPQILVQILTFMLRYLDVVGGELKRMRIARESRAFTARHLGHLRVLGHAAGALFIRSYERGERVHLAMLSRGYTGRLPVMEQPRVAASVWVRALAVPAAALAVLLGSWVLS
ncbi:MAG: cobalt ECF transporter T component CbiQ [Geodermatophilaceae bacterium]|nr:cobalt ECF transporter T component CbiQ [Geodermatophilaceae bacterium]